MILLHQHIAYPPASWKDVVKLPSSCSIETCQLAAVETASIVEKYLRYTGGIVNSQFAFCAFVAGRILLVQWRSSEANPLSPAFFSLLQSLQDMSTRWLGSFTPNSDDEVSRPPMCAATELDLAARYAAQLRELQSRCAGDVNFAPAGLAGILLDSSFEGLAKKQTRRIATQQQNEVRCTSTGYVRSPVTSSALSENRPRSPISASELERRYDLLQGDHISVSRPPRHARAIFNHSEQNSNMSAFSTDAHSQYGGLESPAFSVPHTSTNDRYPVPGTMPMGLGGFGQTQPNLSEEDELASMSQMLLEHQFLEMDRVIRLDGTEFFNHAGDGLRFMS